MKFLSEDEIRLEKIIIQSYNEADGAMVLFTGMVRGRGKNSKKVAYIEYEAHPVLAENSIEKLIEQSREKWSINEAIVIHRTGRVNVNGIAVVIATFASHRQAAYEANQFLINNIKQETEIWKKEVFEDGTIEWGKGG